MFKKKAEESALELSSAHSGAEPELVLNPDGKPKRGSFEIYVQTSEGKTVQLWSGVNRGPPRKEKFPDKGVLTQEAKKLL